jgi:hypothetical protein
MEMKRRLDPEIPQPRALHWWEKHSAQIEASWNLTPGGLTLRGWLFSYDGDCARWYRGKSCFWLRGWVRLLGLYVGAGVFFQGKREMVQ